MTPYYLLITGIIGTTLGEESVPQIIGGCSVKSGEFPSVVSINNPEPYCAGSIINKNWIVTSAYCINDEIRTAVIVAGKKNQFLDETAYDIADWASNDDIGLIKIEGEFNFGFRTQPINYIRPEVNSTCFVAGWTKTAYFPYELQIIEERLLSVQTCKEIVRERFDGRQICAVAQAGKGICHGNFGAPLICDGKLAGIVSYVKMGKECAAGCPSAFIKPIEYSDWINYMINS